MPIEPEIYKKWKSSVGLLYDWFAHHSLTWPSLACRWGPSLNETNFKRRQRIYFTEQTDGSEPQTVSIATIDLCKARVASSDNLTGWSYAEKSPQVTIEKQIVHPGGVNKLRECPLYPNLLVTHTDSPYLYVWNSERDLPSGERNSDDTAPDIADLILVGHQQVAEYALALSSTEPKVASGGHDHNVLIWNLTDSNTNLAGPDSQCKTSASQLEARTCLLGHDNIIEDIAFKPDSSHELASVGDDYKLLFWDTRSHNMPIASVSEAHGRSDLHCLDWNKNGHLVSSGSADGILKVWDRRMLGTEDACAYSFSFHKKAIIRIEWDPHSETVLASGGEDSSICIWDLQRTCCGSSESSHDKKRARRSIPNELLFQHVGHKGMVVDFQWNPIDPWTVLSVCDDVDVYCGGGNIQMWRISDLIYRPEQQVLEELQQHARWITTGRANAETSSSCPASNGKRDTKRLSTEIDMQSSNNHCV